MLFFRYGLCTVIISCFAVGVARADLPEPTDTVVSSVNATTNNNATQLINDDNDTSQAWLSSPQETTIDKQISIQEAILIALKNNSTVMAAQLKRIEDKYALKIARKTAFYPTLSDFTTGVSFQQGEKPVYSDLSTGITLNTLAGMGPAISVIPTIDTNGNGSTSLSATQSLVSGFGKYSSGYLSYLSALDTEKENKLEYRSSISKVVDSVVSAYQNLSETITTLSEAKDAYDLAKQNLDLDNVQLKAGTISKSDVASAQTTALSTKISYTQAQDSLKTAYRSFYLDTLGVSVDSKLTVNPSLEIKTLDIPSEEDAIKIALEHNITYIEQKIALEASKRNLDAEENSMLPSLGLTISQSIDNTGSSFTSSSPIAAFSLSIPLDDVSSQSSLIAEKIAYKEAVINLKLAKDKLIASVQDQYREIAFHRDQVAINEDLVKYSKQSLDAILLQNKYGLVSAIDVSSQQTSYLSAQEALVSAKVTVMDDISALDDILDNTLERWNITLKD